MCLMFETIQVLLFDSYHIIIELQNGIIVRSYFTKDKVKEKYFSVYAKEIKKTLVQYSQSRRIDLSQFNLELNGSSYQLRVYQALQKVPFGATVTYGQLGGLIGDELGARAVGNAVGKNQFALFIPCHRVVSKSGIGGFSNDLCIKEGLLKLESKNPRNGLRG